jgi:hypothetical protein
VLEDDNYKEYDFPAVLTKVSGLIKNNLPLFVYVADGHLPVQQPQISSYLNKLFYLQRTTAR